MRPGDGLPDGPGARGRPRSTPRSPTSPRSGTTARGRSSSADCDAATSPCGATSRSTGCRSSPPRARDTGVDGVRGIAVEPMSCPANAFNSGDGLLVLEPGQSWAGAVGDRAGSCSADRRVARRASPGRDGRWSADRRPGLDGGPGAGRRMTPLTSGVIRRSTASASSTISAAPDDEHDDEGRRPAVVEHEAGDDRAEDRAGLERARVDGVVATAQVVGRHVVGDGGDGRLEQRLAEGEQSRGRPARRRRPRPSPAASPVSPEHHPRGRPQRRPSPCSTRVRRRPVMRSQHEELQPDDDGRVDGEREPDDARRAPR